MTERIQNLLDFLNSKKFCSERSHIDELPHPFDPSFEKIGTAENLKCVLAAEKPLIYENDRLGFNRTTDVAFWGVGNVTPNYYRIISKGFDAIIDEIKASLEGTNDPKKLAYGKNMLLAIEAIYDMSEKYKTQAMLTGCNSLYEALSVVPRKGARNFYEALVFMKISVYFLRCSFVSHLTLGRFDQYMYPFYNMSKNQGVPAEEIFEQLEEFFISLNLDTDLYPGIQQGDNGQSIVLGGFDKDGNSMYNELSKMCMKASLELHLIDPKINLRVGKNTPDELYEFATLLTKTGLGFPQYCNDDVVIPGLVKLGYDYKDALDYTVAACWEFIIPNCGADVPNVDSIDFPRIVNNAITENLIKCESFDNLIKISEEYIADECKRIIKKTKKTTRVENHLLSIYTDGCIETLSDLFDGGAKYCNFGCHGTGIATAADSLSAVKEVIFVNKSITKQELLDVLANNFENAAKIRNLLRNAAKMGNNDDFADDIADKITSAFVNNLNNKATGYGGVWRAGTGSAANYITQSKYCPATADGRKAFEPYPSSYSPSLDVKTTGLLSTIQSFTKYDFTNIINGGPLTIEIHDSVLKNDIGIKKTAMLVKEYINLGGHQLQLNSINRDTLLDAQRHPEKYPHLIVRVWGWSGYFNELDVEYQNHIIRRLEYRL